ncbi:F0F1 ATP synthase subunit B [Blattabacterium cuenoti]|uniref:F0F1 ATP synthase subunit B n=1 Tax=Blattabacterium cuenoti TaxID=1653831 RepID=UPI001EE9D11A|nr:F0F1 ATP synthase subunit B [Blattabacterium cuenoti]
MVVDLMSPSFGLIIWHIIIFLCTMYFLSKYAWTPIIKFIDNREKTILISIKNAKKIQEELILLDKQKQQILKEAINKRDSIIKEAMQIKNNIQQQTIQDSILEQRKIMHETKKMLRIEKKIAIQEIKNKIASVSITIAETILKKQLNQNDSYQEKFIENVINNL